MTEVHGVSREEIRGAAHECLRKASGQGGRIELPIVIENPPGPVVPCNAGTLFDLAWQVRSDGRLSLQFYIDGLKFWDAMT